MAEHTPLQKFLRDVCELSRHPCWFEENQNSAIYEVETTLTARLMHGLHDFPDLSIAELLGAVEEARVRAGASPNPGWDYYFDAVFDQVKTDDDAFVAFLVEWMRSNFTRLSIGHKLAAALALTDVPDVPLHSPWHAWSLAIPDGFFTNLHVARHKGPRVTRRGKTIETGVDITVDIKRVWFIETQLVAVLADAQGELEGTVIAWGPDNIVQVYGDDIYQLLRNMGLCALAVIQNHPAKQSGSWGGTRSKANDKRLLKPRRRNLPTRRSRRC